MGAARQAATDRQIAMDIQRQEKGDEGGIKNLCWKLENQVGKR